MPGTLVLVVGPSGVGKDTLISGACAALRPDSRFAFAVRSITRSARDAHENFTPLSETDFEVQLGQSGFMLHWRAHGLGYGIPVSYERDLAAGRHLVVNASRSVIGDALQRYGPVLVVEVTAKAGTIEQRLKGRRRESTHAIERRLNRKAASIPADACRITLRNDAAPEEGIRHFTDILQSLTVDGQAAMKRKLRGGTLGPREYRRIIGGIVNGEFGENEAADFLVATAETLGSEETVDLARIRTEYASALDWNTDMVVDKHSMGGVPGSRITMIVVPIVAAFGMTIPKTSSRSITSPAGTADAMEVVARVDLDPGDVRRVVRETNGCIVWNGRISHSRVDDVMNALTRPLRLNSLKWAVASILSKKIAAGTTHCVIDIPVGGTAKVNNSKEAHELRDLFHTVGNALGLTLDVRLTNGSAPIGRGIGPVLEARDVLDVLRNEPGAPPDLRSKALEFAAYILDFAAPGSLRNHLAVATELLESGAAYECLRRIIAAQGPNRDTLEPGHHVAEIPAGQVGRIKAVDCFALAGIARAAGAPVDKRAGLDLMARTGDLVAADTPLYRVHAGTENGLASALERADDHHAFEIGEN